MGGAGDTRRSLVALALTYVALALLFVLVYRSGLLVGAVAMLEMLAMLALAVGVAWATARKR
jgi:hypothetical protein